MIINTIMQMEDKTTNATQKVKLMGDRKWK